MMSQATKDIAGEPIQDRGFPNILKLEAGLEVEAIQPMVAMEGAATTLQSA
jgi:hypothetical protein